jgi:RNA:NAD 2'-phosphotransferase (TPT1/KptA family)
MKFYHGTKISNVDSIRENGLMPVFDYVYLTDSLDSAIRWMGFRFAAMGEKDIAIIEVDVEEKELSEGYDHSPLMEKIFGTGKSLISETSISPDMITDVHFYKLGNTKSATRESLF